MQGEGCAGGGVCRRRGMRGKGYAGGGAWGRCGDE